MNDENFENPADGFGSVTTWVYDAETGLTTVTSQPPDSAVDCEDRRLDADQLERRAAAPSTAQKHRQPILTHTFEFRLNGSETQEQWLRVTGDSFRPAERVVAMRSVRTSLTRDGNAAGSAVNDVEVAAEARPAGIFCTAKLSDFGAGDLVVVRVEVALY
jgi:hypothetical protein